MIDSHCHLDLPQFDNDREAVFQRAEAAGIHRFHVPGTTAVGWQKQGKLASAFGSVDYSLGLHPYFLTHNWPAELAQLQQLLAHKDWHPIAIGEIGLDKAINIPFATQEEAFAAQLDIAKQFALPVILHHRKSQPELLKIIKQQRFTHGGILHAFSGSEQAAQQFIEHGFLLGIGGTITYPRAKKTRVAVGNIDLQHLVLETDSPDMPVFGKQGKRNEPANLASICATLAELKNVSVQQVAQQTTENYLRMTAKSFNAERNK